MAPRVRLSGSDIEHLLSRMTAIEDRLEILNLLAGPRLAPMWHRKPIGRTYSLTMPSWIAATNEAAIRVDGGVTKTIV